MLSNNACMQVETEQTFLIGIDAAQPKAGSWIGLGLSEGGGMRGSDLWIVGPKSTLAKYTANSSAPLAKQLFGDYMVLDTWSTDFVAPTADFDQVRSIFVGYIHVSIYI